MQAVGLSPHPPPLDPRGRARTHRVCPSRWGPAAALRGTVRPALSPGAPSGAGPWAQGSCHPRHLGCVCRGPQARDTVGSLAGIKPSAQAPSQEAASVSVYTPGSLELPRSVPVSPGGTSSCGRLPQRNCGLLPKAVLEEAALPQPAGSLPKCITGGETSEETPERPPSRTVAPDAL